MAYSVYFAKEAERNRDAIVAYLVEHLHELKAARRFLGELDAVIDMLESMPESYPAIREERLARQGYRKAAVMRYLVLFKVEGERVLITNIVHQSQDYARLL